MLWATLVGFTLIFARVLSLELGRARLSRECGAKRIEACFNLCVQRPELRSACDAVYAACATGDRYACGARSYLDRHPPRRRW